MRGKTRVWKVVDSLHGKGLKKWSLESHWMTLEKAERFLALSKKDEPESFFKISVNNPIYIPEEAF